MPDLQCATERSDEVLTIFLSGELDLSGVELAEAELAKAEAETSLRKINLDLAGLEFIDSSGIAWLVEATNRSHANSNRLRVRGGRPQVIKLLELTGVAEFLDT
jgi:anti-anti-sigma factor